MFCYGIISATRRVHGRRPDVEARVDRFAEALVARCRDAAVDEIVVLGHSMGSTLAVEVVARALDGAEREAMFARFVEVDAAYGEYRERTTREIPVFELRPEGA